jgi:hypothetical protein
LSAGIIALCHHAWLLQFFKRQHTQQLNVTPTQDCVGAAKWMELENVLSEVTQVQKDKG